MLVSFSKAFYKDLKQTPVEIRRALGEVIVAIEAAQQLQEIRNCKKLQGSEDCYRIRIRDYRATFLFIRIEDRIFFQRILTRGQIYKKHIG